MKAAVLTQTNTLVIEERPIPTREAFDLMGDRKEFYNKVMIVM